MNKLPHSVVLVSSAARTATANGSTITLPIADVYSFVIEVTAASGTGPTLDIAWQNSYDDGTTFQYMPFRTSQISTTRVEEFTFPQNLRNMDVQANQTAATGGLLAKNFIFTRKGRFVWTIGGTNPSFTFLITAYMRDGR